MTVMVILREQSEMRPGGLARRAGACATAMLLAFGCALPAPTSAVADDAGSSASSKSASKSSSAISAADEAAKLKAEEEQKAKEEEAEKKREEADDLFSQASSAQRALVNAQAEYDDAVLALEEATARRDDASERLEAETEKLEELQEDLSEFVVDMYKQGGVNPYLDVLLRSTSYREFVSSWNAFTTVYERGEAVAAERRELKDQIESERASCEEQVEQAERARAVADSKRKQIRATQLALTVQGWNVTADAARVVDDKGALESAEEEAAGAQRALDEAIAEGLAGESLPGGDGFFAHPCPDATVSSGFGYRDFDHAVHKGVDLAADQGTPYYAAESGTVVEATNGGGDNGGAGNWIVIDHGNGYVTKYMHSLVTLVSVGDEVERGQNIGLVGSTGNSTGPHLHFQVEANGVAVDPEPYIKFGD